MYREGRRWGGGIPPWSRLLPAPATRASLHKLPLSSYQKNLYFAVRSRNLLPLSYSESIRQRSTRQPRAQKPQSPRMRCHAFSRAGNVSIAEQIKSPHKATSRHYGHIPNTQASPQIQAKPTPTLPAANDTVCPSIATPTANANGQAKKKFCQCAFCTCNGTKFGTH